ncbi:MAG TPA: endonuclease/exonuclease/phosphatase family protein [Streptosporangiaceae bacterium]
MASDAMVTIGSLNLHCGLSGRGRPFDVPAALEHLKADIIAVQEGWWTAGDADGTNDAAGTGGTDDAGGTGRPDGLAIAAQALGARLIRAEVSTGASLAELSIAPRPERGTWGIAVLTSLPVTGIEILDLGRAPGDRHSRAALICTVTTPGGWPLRLVCTHLTHRFTSPVQLVALTRYLARAPDPPPTVIVGDLNMPRLATWLAAGFGPTVRGRTFPADGPVIQLDHLLTSPQLLCVNAEVLAPVGSDHLPIRAQVRLA